MPGLPNLAIYAHAVLIFAFSLPQLLAQDSLGAHNSQNDLSDCIFVVAIEGKERSYKQISGEVRFVLFRTYV